MIFSSNDYLIRSLMLPMMINESLNRLKFMDKKIDCVNRNDFFSSYEVIPSQKAITF